MHKEMSYFEFLMIFLRFLYISYIMNYIAHAKHRACFASYTSGQEHENITGPTIE